MLLLCTQRVHAVMVRSEFCSENCSGEFATAIFGAPLRRSGLQDLSKTKGKSDSVVVELYQK